MPAIKVTFEDKAVNGEVVSTDFNQLKAAANGAIDDAAGALSAAGTAQQTADGKVDKVTGSRLITTPEANKLANTSGVNTGDQDLTGLQPKITGKSLSTEDFTTAEKTKLVGIALNATAYTDAMARNAFVFDNTPTLNSTNLVNSGSIATALSRATPSLTAGPISFSQTAIYNTPDNPYNGSIIFDFQNAVANTEVYLFYNGASPALPTQAVVTGNTFTPNQLNLFKFIYISNTSVSVTIIGNLNLSNQRIDYIPSLTSISNNAVTAISVPTASTVTLLANTRYSIMGNIRVGTDNSGGVKFGFNYSTPIISKYVNQRGRTTSPSTVTYVDVPVTETQGYNSLYTFSPGFFLVASAGGGHHLELMGTLTTGSANTDVQLIFAPVTAGQQAIVFREGSYIFYNKIGNA